MTICKLLTPMINSFRSNFKLYITNTSKISKQCYVFLQVWFDCYFRKANLENNCFLTMVKNRSQNEPTKGKSLKMRRKKQVCYINGGEGLPYPKNWSYGSQVGAIQNPPLENVYKNTPEKIRFMIWLYIFILQVLLSPR